VVKDDSGYEYQSQGSDASSGQASSDNYAFFKYVTPTLPTLSPLFSIDNRPHVPPLSSSRARASFLSSSLCLYFLFPLSFSLYSNPTLPLFFSSSLLRFSLSSPLSFFLVTFRNGY
jgi:hypothetical protein